MMLTATSVDFGIDSAVGDRHLVAWHKRISMSCCILYAHVLFLTISEFHVDINRCGALNYLFEMGFCSSKKRRRSSYMFYSKIVMRVTQ